MHENGSFSPIQLFGVRERYENKAASSCQFTATLPHLELPRFLNDHPHVGPLFLYLNEAWHADAWVNGGGPVPINPASRYRDIERSGISTPDEVLQRRTFGLTDDEAEAVERVVSAEGGMVRLIDCNFNGQRIRNAILETEPKDSLILCFSKTLSSEQAERFGGKKAVVRIVDPSRLLAEINDQIGAAGELREVQYTRGLERGHFLKSIQDGWQSEVRMCWPIDDGRQREVMLSPGHATLLDLTKCKPVQGDTPIYAQQVEQIPMPRVGQGAPAQRPPLPSYDWGFLGLTPSADYLHQRYPDKANPNRLTRRAKRSGN